MRTAVARRRRRRAPIGRMIYIGFCVLFVFVPLYWVLITSIKPSDDYLAVPPVWFPENPTIVHYTAALFAYRGLHGLINSLIISVEYDPATHISPRTSSVSGIMPISS